MMTVKNTSTPVAEQASGKNCDTLIKSALAAYGKAQGKVQEAAVAVMQHAKDYGDCTRAKQLCRGVPARERNSLIGWFALFSPIGVKMGKTAKDDAARFIKKESKNFHDFDLDKAKANNWFDDPAGANPEPKALDTLTDFYGIIDRLLKNAIEKADEKYVADEREAVKADAAELRKMIGRFHAKQLAAKATNTPVVEKVDTDTDTQPAADAAAAMAAAGA